MTQTVDTVAHARDWMEITAYQHRVDTHEAHEVAELLLAEVEKLRDALRRVRCINWNWSGPANRNDQGEWVVRKQFEDKMMETIADAIGPLN